MSLRCIGWCDKSGVTKSHVWVIYSLKPERSFLKEANDGGEG